MHVYFVRHGETELNKKFIHQSSNTPLSVRGKEMVQSVAESLRDVNADLLLTSEYVRARESAEIIGEHIGLTPVTNGLFHEAIRPSCLYHKSFFHPETFLYVVLSVLYRNRAEWRYKDAENATDVSNRAHKALKYIESLRDAHASVVIVTHSVFLNIMLAYMCRDRMLSIRDLFGVFFRVLRLKNADVIHAEYREGEVQDMCHWRIVHKQKNS